MLNFNILFSSVNNTNSNKYKYFNKRTLILYKMFYKRRKKYMVELKGQIIIF